MKVVHVIIGLRVGGAELMLKRLVEHSGGNIEHVIISLTDKGTLGQKIIDNGISVYCLNLNKLNFAFLGPIRLIKLLKRLKPQVVQTWMYHSDLIGGLCAKYIGVDKVIWSIRSTDIDKGGSKVTVMIRKILSKLSYIVPSKIVCAAYKSKEVHTRIGYDDSKMIVIPNGFTEDKFEYKHEECVSLEKELCLEDKIVITSVGRYHPIKNHKLFIQSCDTLSKRTKEKKFAFIMIGRGINDKNDELKNWISQCEEPDNFILLDERKDVKELLAISDIYCLHSLSEGFPNVLGEAMCLGRLCVSTDVGDAKQMLSSKKYVAKNNSISDLSDKLEMLVSLEENELEKVSSSNINRIRELYSMKKIIQEYSQLYLELCR